MKFLTLILLLVYCAFGFEKVGQISGSFTKLEKIGGTNYVVSATTANSEVGDKYGFVILDYSDVSDIKIVSEYFTSATVEDITVDGDTLYLAVYDGEAGLEVVNISNIESPSKIKSIALTDDPYYAKGWRSSLSPSKEILAVSSYYKTVLFDVSTPSNPLKVTTIENSANAIVFTKDNNYLMLLNDNTDSYVYNIADLSNIALVGSLKDYNYWISGAVLLDDDQKLYVANSLGGGLVMYDVLKQNDDSILINNAIKTTATQASSGIASTSDEEIVYFTSGSSDGSWQLSKYDTKTNTQTTIELNPSGIAIDMVLSDDEKYLIVSQNNSGYGDIFIVDTNRSISSNEDNTTEDGDTYTISVKPGWSMVGATDDYNIVQLPDEIDIAWRYEDGIWKLYCKDTSNSTNYGYEQLSVVHKGEGFWVKNNSSSDVNIIMSKTSLNEDTIDEAEVVLGIGSTATEYLSLLKPMFDTVALYKDPISSYLKTAMKDLNGSWISTDIPLTQNSSKLRADVSYLGSDIYGVYQNSDGKLAFLSSNDYAQTWNDSKVLDDVSSNIEADIVSYGSKIFVCYHSHNDYNLNFAFSEDAGDTWSLEKNIYGSEAGYGCSIGYDGVRDIVYIAHAIGHATQGGVVVSKLDRYNTLPWSHKIIENDGSTINLPSIKVSYDNVKLVYNNYDLSNNVKELKFAISIDEGDTYDIKTIDTIENFKGSATVLSAKNDDVAVTYAASGKTKVAKSLDNGVTWSLKEIGTIDTNIQFFRPAGYFKYVDSYTNLYQTLYVDAQGNLRFYSE
ncbi:MAG: hypothetical protein JXQ66_08015 [Campylobacterales bacterium]|nr:hypothetical protein [Campylobacterales bacterium]